LFDVLSSRLTQKSLKKFDFFSIFRAILCCATHAFLSLEFLFFSRFFVFVSRLFHFVVCRIAVSDAAQARVASIVLGLAAEDPREQQDATRELLELTGLSFRAFAWVVCNRKNNLSRFFFFFFFFFLCAQDDLERVPTIVAHSNLTVALGNCVFLLLVALEIL
jgi:hypothetical protein